jgi:hypothetical protein
MEKAFAKLQGSYGNLDGGLETNGFSALTGAPALMYYFSNTEFLIQKMLDANLKGYLMVTGTIPGKKVRNGIIEGHTYAVLDV